MYWHDVEKLCDNCIGCESVSDGDGEGLCLLEDFYIEFNVCDDYDYYCGKIITGDVE